jgi:two-component system, chemotaxis family, CheB/CheR fusion protein
VNVPTEESPLRHVVVVGSSAGGIQALSVLAGSLPTDFPAPVVIAQHLDPHRPSQLATILGHAGKLPVVVVGDDTPLEQGKLYVVPSNRHVVVRDGHVGLASDHLERPRPSVDLLLSSAAKAYGERLIAVILTGAGSDGAAGAVEVKDAGGTVIIQNPRTAAHPSMPMALPPTAVDHVVELEQIGSLLHDITSGADLRDRTERFPDDVLADLLARISHQSHVDFRQYKPGTILRRIGRRMVVNRAHTLEEYRDFIESHPQEIEDLAKSLLIKVTEFFRDPEAFAFLEHDVFPGLIARGRERGRVLRLWSAGCATGEEAYSLASLLAHLLGNELHDWNIRIFATDLDHDAVSFARRGIYPAPVMKSLPDDYVNRYFERADQGYRVSKALRQMIVFGQQDLSRGVPFPRIDLVVCRNLLIYFKAELQQEVLDLFAYSLHQSGGHLFLGKAETARPSKAVFELVNKKWKVYRCISGPLPTLTASVVASRSSEAPAARNAGALPEPTAESPRTEAETQKLRRSFDALLRHLPIGVVLIDRKYEIFSHNPAARRLLGIRQAPDDQDFLHSARALPYREVRNAIDRVIQDLTPVVITEIEVGEGHYVSLQIGPFEGAESDLLCVAVFDTSELVKTRRHLDALQAEQQQLTVELGSTNSRLSEMNKELQDANEELQAANEEMMLAHEELQATNEEFEATNEELQATNEELETSNEEMQATNEELETTNEELHARTSELQEMTRILGGERHRLSEIVELAPFHIVVLQGPALVVQSLSPPPTRLIGGERAIGLTFDEVCADPQLEPLRIGVRRAFVEDRAWNSERLRAGTGNEARWYVFTAVPTHNEERRVEGVVVYMEDVTERVLREESDRLERFRVMMENSEQLVVAIFSAFSGRLVHASEHFLRLAQAATGIEPQSATQHTVDDLWFGSGPIRSEFERAARTREPVRIQEARVPRGREESVWSVSLVPIDAEPRTGRGPTSNGSDESVETEKTDSAHYVMITAVEITDAVLTRERYEQLDRIKDEFLSLTSHELRTPLTPMTAYTEVFNHLLTQEKRGPEWDARMKELVTKLGRQVTYISRLTDDLVDVTRLQSGKFSLEVKRLSLARVVSQAVEEASMIATKPPIRLAGDTNGDLAVQGDEVRLKQVVSNLISNALKHAPDSPSVDVSVVRVRRDGRAWARIEVKDQGPGVPPEMREHLFERFYQAARRSSRTARAGLGLGLFIARRIVEQHEGRIGADFGDRSTVFWIELPLS